MRNIPRSAIFCIFLLLSLAVEAGQYPVSEIPKALLKNASAVIRKQEQTVEIRALNKVVIKDHYVITILNEKADNLAYFSDYYSNLRTINHIEGTLYDAAGNKLRTVRKADIKDEPVSSSMTMVDDDRIKYHNFYHKDYPYTIEYESEVVKDESMFLPSWAPVPGRNISVEQSTCTVIAPVDYLVRTKQYNFPSPPVITVKGKEKYYTWSISQQAALIKEYAGPAIHELAPYISFGPSDFKLDNYSGSMRAWEDYGRFITAMNAGLGELPQQIRDKANALVAGAKTDEEKVTRLYHFMQQNTHYIGIQLGVGGWRPFSASYVASKGYGDCKALSNYMVALLQAVGIKANYVLIRAGENERDISVDFPASQFNHAICAVPMKNDTMWLECTSQTVAAGYMGSFTGNRHALLITENGGKIVATPRYDKSINQVVGLINGTVDQEGKLTLTAKVRYQAECTDDLHSRIHAYSREEQLKYLKQNLDLPHYDITDFSYDEKPGRIPVITESLSLVAPSYSQVTGKRLFVSPNVLNRWDTKLAEDTSRLYSVDLSEDRIELDTVFLSLPANYKPESLPREINLTTSFGEYKSNVVLQGDQLVYTRRLVLNKGRFPAADYNKLVKFYDQVYKADRAKVVLIKPE